MIGGRRYGAPYTDLSLTPSPRALRAPFQGCIRPFAILIASRGNSIFAALKRFGGLSNAPPFDQRRSCLTGTLNFLFLHLKYAPELLICQ